MEKEEVKIKTIPNEIWERMQADIAEIKVALLGNEYNPSGALHQLKQHEKCITELQTRFNKLIWMAAGGGAVAGFLISILFKLLPLISH